MEESFRLRAAKAKKRAAQPTEEAPGEPLRLSKDKPAVTISDLNFAVDPDTQRRVDEERSKVRDILGFKDVV